MVNAFENVRQEDAELMAMLEQRRKILYAGGGGEVSGGCP